MVPVLASGIDLHLAILCDDYWTIGSERGLDVDYASRCHMFPRSGAQSDGCQRLLPEGTRRPEAVQRWAQVEAL